MTLDELNELPSDQALAEFARCCGSTRWADAMVGERPFPAPQALFDAAETVADTLVREDWLEAFSHHPRIGDIGTLRAKFAATRRWAETEQSGASSASDDVLHALARENDLYFERFGYIFIVCATGRTAPEMLDILRARLSNDPADELTAAAAEQRKITRLRLEKLLS